MTDLARAASALVHAATHGNDDRALRRAVGDVLASFDPKDAATARKAMRILDAGSVQADGRAAQVLLLALGALVEAGASPELAWPTVARGLPESLASAASFAKACMRMAEEETLEAALDVAGPVVARKKPLDAAAWKALPSRCLAAVACLVRSRKLRKRAASDPALAKAVSPLEDAVAEVGFLSRVLRMLDDETLLVIHPATLRGFRVKLRDVASNLELFVLLADALVGDPKAGFIPGKKPDARAVAFVKNLAPAAKKPPTVAATFALAAWTALLPDGTLASPSDAQGQWLWPEGPPAEIPPFEGERVVLLASTKSPGKIAVEPAFPATHPELRVTKKLREEDVSLLLAKMGKAAKRFRKKA